MKVINMDEWGVNIQKVKVKSQKKHVDCFFQFSIYMSPK